MSTQLSLFVVVCLGTSSLPKGSLVATETTVFPVMWVLSYQPLLYIIFW